MEPTEGKRISLCEAFSSDCKLSKATQTFIYECHICTLDHEIWWSLLQKVQVFDDI